MSLHFFESATTSFGGTVWLYLNAEVCTTIGSKETLLPGEGCDLRDSTLSPTLLLGVKELVSIPDRPANSHYLLVRLTIFEYSAPPPGQQSINPY